MITLASIREETYKVLETTGSFPNELHVNASEWSGLVDEIYVSTHNPSGPPIDFEKIHNLKVKRGYVGNLFGIPLFVDNDPA